MLKNHSLPKLVDWKQFINVLMKTYMFESCREQLEINVYNATFSHRLPFILSFVVVLPLIINETMWFNQVISETMHHFDIYRVSLQNAKTLAHCWTQSTEKVKSHSGKLKVVQIVGLSSETVQWIMLMYVSVKNVAITSRAIKAIRTRIFKLMQLLSYN